MSGHGSNAPVLTFDEVAVKVNETIKDPRLKILLFGIKDVKAKDISNIGVIYKMMTLAFLFTYAKYKQSPKPFSKSPNAKRVADAFDCIYNGEDIGLDLIIYVLTEMQLDAMALGDRSCFFGIFENRSRELQIPKLRTIIGTWLKSAKHALRDEAVLCENFYGLFSCLTLFSTLKLVMEDDGYVGFKFGNTEIPSYSLIKKEEDGGFFYLVSYEISADQHCLLSYYAFEDKQVMQISEKVSDFLDKAHIRNHYSEPKSILAKSFFSLSFKYIKNLSLAISDTITKATKRKLYEHYSIKYSDIFELGYKSFEEVNWDNTITILMIEEGPSELLEFLLDSDGFYFDKILHNLELRYNHPGFAHEVKEDYEEAQDTELAMAKKYSGDNLTLIKNLDSINKTFMAKSIIDGLARIDKNKKQNNAHFVESLPMRIKALDKIIASSDPNSQKAIKINKILEKTFRHILPFYRGIIAYQKERDRITAERGETNDDLSIEDRKRCESKFLAAAKKEYGEIKGASLGMLVGKFRDFSSGLVRVTNKAHPEVTEDGNALKNAIGRDYICRTDSFRQIIDFTKNDTAGINMKKLPQDITNFVNNEKHDKPEAFLANLVLFNKFLLKAKELLYYFIYNEDYQREMILGQQISYDPIYPYVVRYTVKSENRDGYNINNFSVFITDDNITSEVKILSEWDYEINEKYYCIPNISTSNKHWWIDPFLISCKKYDEIIYGDGKGDADESEE